MKSHLWKIILASGSPRRKQILQNLRLKFQVIPAHIDETPFSNEKARHVVARLAKEKAMCVKEMQIWPKKTLIIAADTIVVCDEKILGKPRSQIQAQRFLSMLSDRWHHVYTSFCLIALDNHISFQIIHRVVRSSIRFHRLSRQDIEAYVKTGEGIDKAGAYAVQGEHSLLLVDQIRGSYSNIVGLPISELSLALTELKIIESKK